MNLFSGSLWLLRTIALFRTTRLLRPCRIYGIARLLGAFQLLGTALFFPERTWFLFLRTYRRKRHLVHTIPPEALNFVHPFENTSFFLVCFATDTHIFTIHKVWTQCFPNWFKSVRSNPCGLRGVPNTQTLSSKKRLENQRSNENGWLIAAQTMTFLC